MILSRPSTTDADPLSSMLAALGPRRLRCTRFEATGPWSLTFPARGRLKFVTVRRGRCWLSLPGASGRVIAEGDALVLGQTRFTVTSEPALTPLDGLPLYAGSRDAARLGGDDLVMAGGGLTFDDGPMRRLLGALPPLMVFPAGCASAAVVGDAIRRLEAEVSQPRPGGPLLMARLTDVLLIEAMRAGAGHGGPEGDGVFGALADRRISTALRLMHQDVGRRWTVALLAAAVGMSRSAFATRFARLVGRPPLDYLRAHRLQLARCALGDQGADLVEVAERLGYRSQSAFGHAYKRAHGLSPRRSTRLHSETV